MKRSTSLQVRLIGMVLLAAIPGWAVVYFVVHRTGAQNELLWLLLAAVAALLGLGAAWFGGERFIMRKVRRLEQAARLLGEGALGTRTGLETESGALGDLARSFDRMAVALEKRAEEREETEKTVLTRALQQTVVSALGQFALISRDLPALLNQAALMVTQTLEVQYCGIFELDPEGQSLSLREGVGWKEGRVGRATVMADPRTQIGYSLTAGEPVVVQDLGTDARFEGSLLLLDHGVVSGVTVAIAGQGQSFGVLGAHSTEARSFSEDEVHFLLAVATILAMGVARNRDEAELEKLAAFAKLSPNPVLELSADGKVTYFNQAALDLAGLTNRSPAEMLPSNIGSILQTCLREGRRPITLESQVDGRSLFWSFHPVPSGPAVYAYVTDWTERMSLERQLRQAQKMESLGQLAAGVAHDFNNLLTIIQGHSGLLLARGADLHPGIRDSAAAIFSASERAAGLTSQLLMFSRKGVIQPKLLDLREVISNTGQMLQRLLGETIALRPEFPAELPLIWADKGMIEQVLMNLAVNARDAMPRGGTLTIRADAVTVGEEQVANNPNARPGPCVCLQVTDTGCGMDSATMARIFEPFFTTKEVGKGTGLGLATVYGIVQQHEGWVEVTSELGQGTSFRIYFAARTQPLPASAASEVPTDTSIIKGKETILLVEDEPALRDLANVILQDCGYEVLEAASGRQALELWANNQDKVDMVITDMIMPEGVSGMDLARRLLSHKPDLKVMFVSGYSLDEMDTSFIRRGQAAFVQKPYTHASLARAVRECLDTATPASPQPPAAPGL